MASATEGATCDASSSSGQDRTCLAALLRGEGHWETDEEGPGAWIKVSFPRANVARIGLRPVCNDSTRIKTLAVDMGSTGDADFDVSAK